MSTHQELACSDMSAEPFIFHQALESIVADTVRRSALICRRLGSPLPILFTGINKVVALPNNLVSRNPTSSSQDPESLTGPFEWSSWNRRADDIRHNATREQCMIELNALLATIAPLDMASATGSSGALTLLPTAGALIGAPSKELWVVYKLMPVAGVLSMMLSLGGNIVPTEASGYQMKAPRFSYGGLVASRSNENDAEEPDDLQTTDEPDSQVFANMVERRAKDPRGGQRFVRVWYGIILQLCWIGVVMTACWFAGSGSILVWWCKVSEKIRDACHDRFYHSLTYATGLGLDVALVPHASSFLHTRELRRGPLY